VENDDLGPSPFDALRRKIIETIVRMIEDCVSHLLGMSCWSIAGVFQVAVEFFKNLLVRLDSRNACDLVFAFDQGLLGLSVTCWKGQEVGPRKSVLLISCGETFERPKSPQHSG